MSVLRFLIFFILSAPLYATPKKPWVAPTHCNTKSEQIEAIENLLQSVCVLDGQGGHICGDKAQIMDLKSNKIISEKKIDKPIANAVETVITKSSTGDQRQQVHLVTTEGEVQKYDPVTRELQSVKLNEALERLASSRQLEGPLKEFVRSQDLSNNISNLASKASFSSDGKFLILPQENQNQDLRIPVEQLFEAPRAQNLDYFQPSSIMPSGLLQQKFCPKTSKLVDFFVADRDCIDESYVQNNQKDTKAQRPHPSLILDPYRGAELNLEPQGFAFSLNPFSALDWRNLGSAMGQKISKAIQMIPLGLSSFTNFIHDDFQSLEQGFGAVDPSQASGSTNLRLVSSTATQAENSAKTPPSKIVDSVKSKTSASQLQKDPSLKLADALLAKLGISNRGLKKTRDDEIVRKLNHEMGQKPKQEFNPIIIPDTSIDEKIQNIKPVTVDNRSPSQSVVSKSSLKPSSPKQTQGSSNKDRKKTSGFSFGQDPILYHSRRRRLLLARPNESF